MKISRFILILLVIIPTSCKKDSINDNASENWRIYNEDNSEISGSIFDIEIDAYNNIWLGTSNGLLVFNENKIIGIK